jgi:hypothetical protein
MMIITIRKEKHVTPNPMLSMALIQSHMAAIFMAMVTSSSYCDLIDAMKSNSLKLSFINNFEGDQEYI